jgi:hypothetical protein
MVVANPIAHYESAIVTKVNKFYRKGHKGAMTFSIMDIIARFRLNKHSA